MFLRVDHGKMMQESWNIMETIMEFDSGKALGTLILSYLRHIQRPYAYANSTVVFALIATGSSCYF